MDYSRRRRSRRSRRGGSALSPALLGGRQSRRSRRNRRGGSVNVNFPLSPAAVGGLASTSAGGDPNIPSYGIDGAGITNGGVMGQSLTAGGGYGRSRQSRRRR